MGSEMCIRDSKYVVKVGILPKLASHLTIQLSQLPPPPSPSVCLSACLSVCLPVCLPACLPACLSVCLAACLSVFLSVCLPACLPVCLSLCLSVCKAGCKLCLAISRPRACSCSPGPRLTGKACTTNNVPEKNCTQHILHGSRLLWLRCVFVCLTLLGQASLRRTCGTDRQLCQTCFKASPHAWKPQ